MKGFIMILTLLSRVKHESKYVKQFYGRISQFKKQEQRMLWNKSASNQKVLCSKWAISKKKKKKKKKYLKNKTKQDIIGI